jgi:hypothetical protein
LRIADPSLHYALHLIGLFMERRSCCGRLFAGEEPVSISRLQPAFSQTTLSACV